MTTPPQLNSAELYTALCLTADEYTSFRNMMMSSPNPNTAETLELAMLRADKIAGLLRQLRERRVLAFADLPTSTSVPAEPVQKPAPAPAPAPPPQTPPPQPFSSRPMSSFAYSLQ